jgi:hypothetical protein
MSGIIMDIASGFELYDSRLAIFISGTQTAQVRRGAARSAHGTFLKRQGLSSWPLAYQKRRAKKIAR